MRIAAQNRKRAQTAVDIEKAAIERIAPQPCNETQSASADTSVVDRILGKVRRLAHTAAHESDSDAESDNVPAAAFLPAHGGDAGRCVVLLRSGRMQIEQDRGFSSASFEHEETDDDADHGEVALRGSCKRLRDAPQRPDK